MGVENKSVLVLGGGPAGLSAANELAKANQKVEVLVPDLSRMNHSVYTTNRGLGESTSELFFPESQTKRLPCLRVITPEGTDFRVGTNGNKYFALDYPTILSNAEMSISNERVSISKLPASEARKIEIFDSEQGVSVKTVLGTKEYDAVVDATGVNSKISGKDTNYLVEYVYGVTCRGNMDSPDMVLAMGTAGGTSWANPSIFGDDYMDVVFSAYGAKTHAMDFLRTAKPRLGELMKFLSTKKGISLNPNQKPEMIYSGLIRQQPMRTPEFKNIYSVGEAAGMAGPGTGDSIRRAVYSGQIVSEAISSGKSPKEFYKSWRKIWSSDDIMFAAVLGRIPFQENNQLNNVVNEVGNWFKYGEVNGGVVRRIEDYLIEGKMSWELFLRILSSPKFVRSFAQIGKEIVRNKVQGAKLPDHLPLPQV